MFFGISPLKAPAGVALRPVKPGGRKAGVFRGGTILKAGSKGGNLWAVFPAFRGVIFWQDFVQWRARPFHPQGDASTGIARFARIAGSLRCPCSADSGR